MNNYRQIQKEAPAPTRAAHQEMSQPFQMPKMYPFTTSKIPYPTIGGKDATMTKQAIITYPLHTSPNQTKEKEVRIAFPFILEEETKK